MKKGKEKKIEWVKSLYPGDPELNYYLPKEDKKIMRKLSKSIVLGNKCQKVCTKIITLIPKVSIQPHWGLGYFMMNVDGFRYINAYVISSRLLSTNQRGFTLAISFSLNDFVYGVGVVGETKYFFNFENFYNNIESYKKIIHCGTSDQTELGGVPQIGGVDLTHLLRVPVMGPFIRATVINNDEEERQVEVKAYLTT